MDTLWPSLLALATLVVVDLLAILSPGPSILLVSQTAVERDRGQGLVAGIGITLASLIWASVALTGLSVVFQYLPWLQTAIQIAGAAYLIHLGIVLWRTPAGAAEATPSSAGAASASFLRGFLTGLLNPKALAYFASIFVLLVPPDAPAWMPPAAVALVAADNLVVYAIAAALFSSVPVRRGYLALRRPINRICGTFMILLGAKLVLNRN